MRLVICIVLCAVCGITATKAQNQVYRGIDSLNSLAKSQWDFNKDSVKHFADQALDRSLAAKYINGEINARINLCFFHYLNGDSQDAIVNCENAIDLDKSSLSRLDVSSAYVFLGLTKVNSQKYNEAINTFMQLIDIATQQRNDYLLADACSNLGLAYVSSGQYKKASIYYKTSAKIHKNIDHPHGRVYVFQNLGRIFFDQAKYDSAIYYLKNSHQMAIEIGNNRALCYAATLLGQIPSLSDSLKEKYLITAQSLSEKLDMPRELIISTKHLSDLYFQKKEIKKSLEYAILAAKQAQKAADYEMLSELYSRIVRMYTTLEKFDEAETYLEKFHVISDSLNNQKNDYLAGVIGANELLDEERNYEQAKSELTLAQGKIRQNQIIIFSVIICSLLIIAMMIILVRANQIKTKSNYNLKEVNEKLDAALKEKDILMGMIAHDLRSPLNKIIGLTNILKMDSALNENQQDMINMVYGIADDTKLLTKDLLEVNQIESNQVKKQSDEIKVDGFVNEMIFHFQPIANSKEIELDVDFNLTDEIFISDKSMLQRILENLISNALKFTPSKGKVNVFVDLKDNVFTFRIKDSGPGIPDKEHELLFKKFGKASPRPTGNESSTGLGLYIVNHLISKLNGTISLKSKQGSGAEFQVNIPLLS